VWVQKNDKSEKIRKKRGSFGKQRKICTFMQQTKRLQIERAVQAYKAIGIVPFAMDIIVQTAAEFERLRTVQGTLQHRTATDGRTIYHVCP
jgi:hypothetical protein